MDEINKCWFKYNIQEFVNIIVIGLMLTHNIHRINAHGLCTMQYYVNNYTAQSVWHFYNYDTFVLSVNKLMTRASDITNY